jgi:hypothetical protein
MPDARASRENGKKGGRPKGRKNAVTLDKEAAREYLRQRVIAALGLSSRRRSPKPRA